MDSKHTIVRIDVGILVIAGIVALIAGEWLAALVGFGLAFVLGVFVVLMERWDSSRRARRGRES